MKRTDNLETFGYGDFEGSLDEVIAMIQGLKERYSDKEGELLFREDLEQFGGTVLRLSLRRDETEKERSVRLKTERRQKQLQEDAEKTTLKRLKEKYEKNRV